MKRRSSEGIVVGLLAVLAASAAVPAPNLSGYPNSIAAVGDSITRAYNTGAVPFTDASSNSWSTGSRDPVRSHYLRVLEAESAILDRNFNEARSGAKVRDLDAQAASVNDRAVAYVTVLIGANDLCTRTVDRMTSVETFRTEFEEAVAVLSAGSPRARIFVASIPNVYRLWVILKDNLLARTAWRTFDICRSLLEDPRSTDADDVARRRAVRQRTIAFNAALEDVCAMYIHCRFDDDAVFADPFTPDDVSKRDYFHPSLEGQERLARVTWTATFDFTDATPPVSSATTSQGEGGAVVTLTATDDVGVGGIEYRLNLGAWQRYAAPVVLRMGDSIRFRAVDVNGNTEATHVLAA